MDSTDPNRTLVNNIGRATVTALTVKFGTGILLELENADVYLYYADLWKTPRERANGHQQGIDETKDRNVTKI